MCNEPGHDHTYDWEHQNKLKIEWHLANPDAEYEGWMSI